MEYAPITSLLAEEKSRSCGRSAAADPYLPVNRIVGEANLGQDILISLAGFHVKYPEIDILL